MGPLFIRIIQLDVNHKVSSEQGRYKYENMQANEINKYNVLCEGIGEMYIGVHVLSIMCMYLVGLLFWLKYYKKLYSHNEKYIKATSWTIVVPPCCCTCGIPCLMALIIVFGC